MTAAGPSSPGRGAEITAAAGVEVIPVVADVLDTAAVESTVGAAAEHLGGLEIVVNAAARVSGGGIAEDLHGVAEEAIATDFDEKFPGALRVVRAALPHLRRAGWGRIVTIGGRGGVPGLAALVAISGESISVGSGTGTSVHY